MATRDGVAFDRLCEFALLPKPVPEYAFATTLGRRWRFDWAWPAVKVALEIDGGLFAKGRHVRAAGIRSDMEKLNTAQIHGWIVLRCLPETLGHFDTLTLVRQALASRIEVP